jgi:hypothetical protein
MATKETKEKKVSSRKGVPNPVGSRREESLAHWKELAYGAREDAREWANRFDKLAKEQEEMRKFVKTTINQLKNAFSHGIYATGTITREDINYNLDLLPRMMDHKFFKEEKEQD